MPEEAVKEIKVDRKHRKIGNIAPELADRCYTCGTCAGGCPATGLVPGWDPRKAIRAIVLGMEQEVIDSKWPWVCTLCGRCQYQCPMGIQLMRTFRACRTARERDKVPGPIHKGTMMNLQRGNNLGIPKDDFLFLLAELGVEMENDEEQPYPRLLRAGGQGRGQHHRHHQLQGALRRAGRHEVLVEDLLRRQGRLDRFLHQLGRRQLGPVLRGRRVHEGPGRPGHRKRPTT